MTHWTSELQAHRAPLLKLEEAASAAYNAFVYRDEQQAALVRTMLFDRGVAEFTGPRTCGMVHDGRLMAFISALPAEELRKCRMKSALAIAKAGFFDEDPELYGRMQVAATTGASLEDGDHYISRVAVDPQFSGRGLAGLLIEHARERAASGGASRLTLEVASQNHVAQKLYLRHGFQEVAVRQADDPRTGRSLSLIQLAKRV